MLRSAGLSARHLFPPTSATYFRPIRHPICDSWPSTRQRSVSTSPSPNVQHTVPQVNARQTLPHELLVMLDNLLASGPAEDAHQTVRQSPALSELFLDPNKVREAAVALAQTPLPQRATQLLRFANGRGCQLKQNAYEGAAHQLAMLRHWNRVIVVVNLGIEHTHRTTVRLLNWRTRALLETQNYGALEKLLTEFDRYGLKPNRRTFHLLIAAHIRNHNMSLAKECLQRMHADGYAIDPSTYALITTVYRVLGIDTRMAEQAVQSLPPLPSSVATAVLNSLLQMYLDVGDLKGAYSTLSLFHQSHIDTPIMTAFRKSIILEGGARPRSSSDASSSKGPSFPPIHRNAGTFSILINHTASRKDRACAMQYLQVMIAEGIQPTIDTVVSLTHVYFATGDEAAAIHLISDMCRGYPRKLFKQLTNLVPTASPPFSAVAIPPTTQAFNALIRGLLRTKGIGRIHLALRIMDAHGLKPNAATFEIILNYLDRLEHTRPRELLRVLRCLTVIDIRPNLHHMHVILRAIFRREKFLLHGSGWNVIGAKFSSRRRDLSRYAPDRLSSVADTFDPTAGIQLTVRHRYRFFARPIIQSLTARSVRSDAAMVALRIRHDAVIRKDLESARHVFSTLLARGMRPQAHHFAALMEGHALAGDIPGAEDVMEAAVRAGVRSNVVFFTILIVGYARLGKPRLALQTFQQMVQAGIKPDVPAIDAVASAFFAVGMYAMSRRVLTSLWGHIAPFPGELGLAPLKTLAVHFRSLHEGNREFVTRLTKQQSLFLHRQINSLLRMCKMGRTPRGRQPFSASRLQSSTAP